MTARSIRRHHLRHAARTGCGPRWSSRWRLPSGRTRTSSASRATWPSVTTRTRRRCCREIYRPVWPKPPWPRSLPQLVDDAKRARARPRWTTSWAMRSPRAHLEGSVGSVFTSSTFSSSAVAAVDEPGRVQARDAVAQGQPAAGQHEPGVARRDGDRDAASAPAPGRRRARAVTSSRAAQVDAGVAGSGVRGQRQVGVEAAPDGDRARRDHRAQR